MPGYPHYINTPRYAGLYSRDIIAMVAGGEGVEEEGPVTQSVFALTIRSVAWPLF